MAEKSRFGGSLANTAGVKSRFGGTPAGEPPEEGPGPKHVDTLARGIGQFGTGANEMIAGAVGMPVDAANFLLDKVGLGQDKPFGGSDAIRGLFEDTEIFGDTGVLGGGLSVKGEPKSDLEGLFRNMGRGAGSVATMVAPGALLSKFGGPVAKTVGNALLAPTKSVPALALDVGVGTASEGVGEKVRQETDSPVAGLLASLATGAALPSAAVVGSKALAGGKAGRAVEALDRAGVKPTIGTIAGKNRKSIARTENLLREASLIPTPVSNAHTKQVEQVAKGLRKAGGLTGGKVADNLDLAGHAIKKGASLGREALKSEIDGMETKFLNSLPLKNKQRVYIKPVLDKIDEMLVDATPEMEAKLVNERNALLSMVPNPKNQPNVVPWQKLRNFRTEGGTRTRNLTGPDKGRADQLYNSMVESQRRSLSNVDPKHVTEFDAMMARERNLLDSSLSRRDGGDIPSLDAILKTGKDRDVYNRWVNGGFQDVGALATLKRNLPDQDWKDVQATAVKELGMPTSGNLGPKAEAENFSVERFLSGYNQGGKGTGMTDEAKDILLGPPGEAMRDAVDNIAEAAALIKQRNKAGNPSGSTYTAAVLAALATAVKADVLTSVGVGAGTVASSFALASPTIARGIGRRTANARKALGEGLVRPTFRAVTGTSTRGPGDEEEEQPQGSPLGLNFAAPAMNVNARTRN